MNERDTILFEHAKNPLASLETLAFICGNLLGSGYYRDVFEYNLDPKYVVKIQRDDAKFNNIVEWEIWNTVSYGSYKKHFAPCTWILGNGRILIQRKTTPISKRKPAPEKIPNFFTDVKDSNFGWIGNQFVAHDYDYTLVKLVDFGLTNKEKKYKSHI